MSKLPVASGKETIRALLKTGYYIRGQEGNHIHLRHPFKKPLTISNHKTIAKGTLRAIIREAELSVDEFIHLL